MGDIDLPWHLLDEPQHAAVQMLLRDLNRHYGAEPALHARDTEPGGFEWLSVDDAHNSVYAFARYGGDGPPIVAAFNMTPEPLHGYGIGMPAGGAWREILNSDAQLYGGANIGNAGRIVADGAPMHGKAQSASLSLPPLGAILLRHEGASA